MVLLRVLNHPLNEFPCIQTIVLPGSAPASAISPASKVASVESNRGETVFE